MKILSELKRNTLIKNTYIYTISTFINSGIAVLLLPILTRYLTTAQYGILSMINATVSIASPFVGMSIPSAIQRKMVDDDEEETSRYTFNSFLIMAFSTIITSVVFFILSDVICKYTEIPKNYFWIIILISLMDTIISTALNILQFRDRAALYAVCRNTETLVNVLLSIAFVVCFRLALDGRVYAILISKIMFAVVGVVVIIRFVGFSPQVDITQIKDELFNFGIPMIPTVLKGTILTYLDRIFITNMNSVSETGLYTTGNQLSLPILFLAQAFNMAYLPWLYKKLQEDEPRTKRKIVIMTYIYFGVIAVVAFLWTIFATFVAKYVLGGEYAESTTYIGLLSLGYAFSGMHMMVVGYIYYEKRTKLYNIVTITVIFSNVILNYIFIGNNGSVGAAQATLIVNIISFVLTWIMAAKIHKMPWKLWKKIPSKM